MDAYTVKTERFEGPLDLLLSLIEKRKLLINDISLAAVTDDFIAYLNNNASASLGSQAHFVLVASTLLLIKSKSLLPLLALSNDEQGDIEALQVRLQMYQRFRELSVHIKNLYGESALYARSAEGTEVPLFTPDRRITKNFLLDSARSVIAALPKFSEIPKAVVAKVMSLEEMIGRLSERIAKNLKLSFNEFSGMGKRDKVNVIVSFLAMLELVKQGAISVQQQGHFKDIAIETETVGVPRY